MLVLLGALESYSMHQFMSGAIDVPRILKEHGGETAVEMLLSALPAGKVFLAVYLVIMIVFLAAHVDAVAYAVAATTTRNLEEGQDPSPTSRVFWCVMLTLVPLAMLFVKASLETMKTAVVLTAIPFLVILGVKLFGLFRWLLQDYADTPAHLIEAAQPEGEHRAVTTDREAAVANVDGLMDRAAPLAAPSDTCQHICPPPGFFFRLVVKQYLTLNYKLTKGKQNHGEDPGQCRRQAASQLLRRRRKRLDPPRLVLHDGSRLRVREGKDLRQ